MNIGAGLIGAAAVAGAVYLIVSGNEAGWWLIGLAFFAIPPSCCGRSKDES